MTDKPYVSTSITRLRRRLNKNSTADDFKETVVQAVNIGVDDFLSRLQDGSVKIETTADFDRLVKLGLLAHGEPTEITEDATETVMMDSMSEIENTEEFDKLVEMMSEAMNKQNDDA